MARSFAHNTLLGFTAGAVVALAGFTGNAITARLLGPDKLGVFAYVVWCVTIGTMIASLGIGIVQQRFIPRLIAEGRAAAAEGLIGATTRLAMLAATLGAAALFLFLEWPGSTATQGLSSSSRHVVIALAVGWFICWRMADVYLFYLRGEQRFGELARLSAVSALLKLTVTALGAWLFGIPGALAGYIAANLLPTARMFRLLRIKPHVDEELRREVTSFALASWVTAVIGGVVFGRTEIVFLQHYTGISAVGMFTAAATVVEAAVQLPPLLLSALLPRFSEQFGQGAHDTMASLYRILTALMAMLILPLCLGFAAVTPELVPLLFGAEYADAVPVASVLLIAASISSLGVTTFYLLQSIGRAGFLLISNGSGLVGTIVLGFLLIPRFGLIGAAWSRAVVQVSVVLIETWYVTKRVRISPPYRALGLIALAAIAQGAVAYGLTVFVGGAGSLIVSIPVAMAIYLLAIRLLGVIPLVDPALPDQIISRVPQRIRPLAVRALRLLSPPSAESAGAA